MVLGQITLASLLLNVCYALLYPICYSGARQILLAAGQRNRYGITRTARDGHGGAEYRSPSIGGVVGTVVLAALGVWVPFRVAYGRSPHSDDQATARECYFRCWLLTLRSVILVSLAAFPAVGLLEAVHAEAYRFWDQGVGGLALLRFNFTAALLYLLIIASGYLLARRHLARVGCTGGTSCRVCRYSLVGLVGNSCPECGTRFSFGGGQ